MALSEITRNETKQYLRVSEDDENQTIDIIMQAAKHFILSYTGLTESEADSHSDFSIAFLVLCSEMYDNRQYTVSNDKLNPIVKTILGMHATNYL